MIRTTALAGVVALSAFDAACSGAPQSQAGREALTAESQATVSAFTNTEPTLQELMGRSIGYAVFPDVGKAGFIAGGAYGKGEVYEYGRLVGFADLARGTVGLQASAQSYDELILFLDQQQINKFKSNQFALSANLSAVALQAGPTGAADHSKGVIVFVRARGGLLAEASIGGQQFTFRSLGEEQDRSTYHQAATTGD